MHVFSSRKIIISSKERKHQVRYFCMFILPKGIVSVAICLIYSKCNLKVFIIDIHPLWVNSHFYLLKQLYQIEPSLAGMVFGNRLFKFVPLKLILAWGGSIRDLKGGNEVNLKKIFSRTSDWDVTPLQYVNLALFKQIIWGLLGP